MIKKDHLKAEKVGGRWMIKSESLPLSDGQRQSIASGMATARDAFEKGMEPAAKAAKQESSRQYSVNDLTVFQAGTAIHRELAAQLGLEDPLSRQLAQAMRLIARGCHAFHPPDKARRFAEARDLLADVTTDLFLYVGDGEDLRRSLAERIEQELIPSTSGLVAKQEKRNRKSRFERFGRSTPGTGKG